jgi:hypothetical protein
MRRWIHGFNEGSLLRRTLLHIGALVLGSFTFVAFLSTFLVSTARAILPPHTDEGGAGTTDAAAAEKTKAPGGADRSEPAEPDQT